MTDDRVTFLKVLHSFSYFFHPIGVFVSHDIWEFHIHFLTPDPFDDMKVGAANARSSDSHDDICAFLEFGFFHFLQGNEFLVRKRSIILMQYSGSHGLREGRNRFEQTGWTNRPGTPDSDVFGGHKKRR